VGTLQLGMVLFLLKSVKKKDFKIKNLFGEQCIDLTPNNNIFDIKYMLPEIALQENEIFFDDFKQKIFA
jgi:hypothetical protein